MAKKEQLRRLRTGTVINVTSKKQESAIIQALQRVEARVKKEYLGRVKLSHHKQWLLADIVTELRQSYPDVEFHYHFDRSSIRPDGGILCMQPLRPSKLLFPILIAEVKNQGTNDMREREGLPRQAKGNAIERLGKNVIGLRAALLREAIFPFVCFGYGCDFEPESSILDRVSTVAMFGTLNTTHLFSEQDGKFNRGSFYFREEPWTVEEMTTIMGDIATRSIQYYFAKYREGLFVE